MKKIKENWPILSISLLLLIIYAVNFTPGTYLIGWDNLLPELNIWMNLKRSLFAVWQDYQGLGLVGGMAHAADLIRQIILLPFTLILPNNWIRYLWHFGMLALGTFGVYFGVKGFAKKQPSKEPSSVTSEVFNRSAFIAALFYLLNFGTVQLFWVPYEAFTTYWGFFPWLIFSFITVMKKPSKRNWRKFVIWNILAIPSFYLQTLFVVYGLCLGVISLNFLNKKFIILKSSLIILLINAFWLLPFGYFMITNSHHPRQATINRIATEETFLRNQRRGYLSDFLTFKGYYLDFPDAGKPLMAPWQKHFSSTPITIIGYILGGMSLIGLIKSPHWLRGLLFLSAIAMLSTTPPFSWLNNLFRQSLFLNQVFRSPLTKFIVPTIFTFSLLFPYGLRYIDASMHRKKIGVKGLFIIFGMGIILQSWPVFQGKLIYSEMRTKLPEKYLQLFNYFKNQPKNARIANLPQGNFWGWTFYRFGTDTSGFLWYGIEQPILDRAFDVWNLNNERYYWELTYALQNQDEELLKSILNKYSIEFVIFDDNVIFPQSKNWAKLALKTKEFLGQSDFLTKTIQFDNIDVYKVKKVKTKPYLIKELSAYQTINKLPANQINPDPLFENPKDAEINYNQLEKIDEISISPTNFVNPHHCAPTSDKSEIDFQTVNDEIKLSAKNAAICVDWDNYEYFQKFQTPKLIRVKFEYKSANDEWPKYCLYDALKQNCHNPKDFPTKGFSQQWQTYSENLIFTPEVQSLASFSLIADAYNKQDKEIAYRNVKIEIYQPPKGFSLKTQIENPIEKNLVHLQPQTCNTYMNGNFNLQFEPNEYLRLSSTNDNSCYSWFFPQLNLNQAWEVKVRYRNISGYPLLIAASSSDGQYQMFENIFSDSNDWQTSYLVIPPYQTEQSGIQIQFNNNSYNYHPSTSDISSLEIYPANFSYPQSKEIPENEYLESKGNTWRYSVSLNDQMLNDKPASPPTSPNRGKSQGGWKNSYLVLPQSYDKGWVAVYFNGWRPRILKNHVLVNNWANAWNISSLATSHEHLTPIYLVFWPQILQFLGFGFLIGTMFYIWFIFKPN